MRGPNALGPDRKLPDKSAFDRVFAEPDFRLRRHPFMLLARYRGPGHRDAGHRDAGHRNAGHRDVEPARIGFVVGKKHARRAVARNRIRRMARERFRQTRGLQTSDQGGLDIILMARPGAADLDRAQLAEVLGWLFERLCSEMSRNAATSSPALKTEAAAASGGPKREGNAP